MGKFVWIVTWYADGYFGVYQWYWTKRGAMARVAKCMLAEWEHRVYEPEYRKWFKRRTR